MKRFIVIGSTLVIGLALFVAFRGGHVSAPGFVKAQFGNPLNVLKVDTEKANIPIGDILSGGPPPQGIPALGFSGDWTEVARPTDAPNFVSQDEASNWLGAAEPVIAMRIGDEAKAYPLQILTWHEIVNDTLGGRPVAVTFCPLCNSALAFDTRIPLSAESLEQIQSLNADAPVIETDEDFLADYTAQGNDADVVVNLLDVTFGVSGTLYNSNMLMFDTASSTVWSQLIGVAAVGTLTDTRLLRYPAQIVSFAEFREAFPDAPVLSRDTGFNRRYGSNPYVGYDDADSPPFLFNGLSDGRLPPKARVITVEGVDDDVAYPFEVLAEARVVNDTIADNPVTLFWQEGTASALDQSSIADSRDIGAVGVFNRVVDGQELTFSWVRGGFVDNETGSIWNLLGEAVDGELKGKRLASIVHDNTLWFAWAAFKPETRIYTE